MLESYYLQAFNMVNRQIYFLSVHAPLDDARSPVSKAGNPRELYFWTTLCDLRSGSDMDKLTVPSSQRSPPILRAWELHVARGSANRGNAIQANICFSPFCRGLWIKIWEGGGDAQYHSPILNYWEL